MRILIAEDNADSRDMLSRRLLKRGFDVLVAVDGAEAVALARQSRPGLILMDISMPVMSGLEAIAVIRADPVMRSIPVIALTAHAMPEDRAACLEAGADAFISKPIDFKNLLEAIELHGAGSRRAAAQGGQQ